MRKTHGFTLPFSNVTSGFVLAGESMGVLYVSQTDPPARLRLLATSPITATTLSELMSF